MDSKFSSLYIEVILYDMFYFKICMVSNVNMFA